MDKSSLIIGIVIGIVGAFGAGFLKKAGEDLYLWIKEKIYPKSISEDKPQVIIHLNDTTNQTTEDLKVISIKKINSLTFDEISQAIDLAPPLQREDIAQKYVGLMIEWDTYLRNAYKRENGNIALYLSIDSDYRGRSVFCLVQENEYRELGILKEGAKIRVSGEISNASAYDIDLSNAQLEILST